MSGVHDLGGMHGLERVSVEEPVFHNPWEKVVFGTALANLGQGLYNLGEFRHGIHKAAGHAPEAMAACSGFRSRRSSGTGNRSSSSRSRLTGSLEATLYPRSSLEVLFRSA